MHRLRRQSVVRVGLPAPLCEGSNGPSPTSYPDDLPTPNLVSDRDPTRFAALLGRWSNRPSPVACEPKKKPKQVPSDIRGLELFTPPFDDPPTAKFSSTSRRRRHVPIIITEYASPYGPPQQTPSLGHSLSISKVLPVSVSADATQPGTEPPKIRETETFQNDSQSTMNGSQLSLSVSESGAESAANSIHQSNSQTNLASPVNQQNATSANVSGLVCNVHRTTGHEPPPLVGATTTILGDKLYVFGGRVHSQSQPNLSSRLYELDLVRRHWTKIDAAGDIPPPRYFHSVCALGDTKLVCYGGMSPASHLQPNGNGTSDTQAEVVVMSDIHIYDVPSQKWTQVQPSRSESPEGRYAHCATILPCSAVFASADSHVSAIHHNPSSSDPHSGTLGVQIDGTGGAEMIVVGGQDSNNSYIPEISVFNLRSLKWTSNTPYDRNCGAYKSMVTALPGVNAQAIGRGTDLDEGLNQQSGTPMLIYSNYNFLDVKLELQIRTPGGKLEEKPMNGPVSPPGLRFPNGGFIDGHFVVSGTYLTSSKHEYALWALDLKTLTWAMIDTAGIVFGQGSWNRGILWNRRNTYVILGHRKRNLVEDYNHRRINFAHLCLVELEAYGLYDNPRRTSPSSAYISNSAPAIPASLQQNLPSKTAGGRSISAVAEQLGQTALYVKELCDMELVAQGGEKIPCNSRILARRWGPFFSSLLQESSSSLDGNTLSESTRLRPTASSRASRISALTITPATNGVTPAADNQATRESNKSDFLTNGNVTAASRGRALYLPHMATTIKLMLHFLYTSSLPPLSNPLCSPQTLCSLLQMARPYQIDGLQEATIERLHEVLDGRNAAAVFNAAAMAAGGGRATVMAGLGTLEALERRESTATTVVDDTGRTSVLANDYGARRGHGRTGSGDSTSTATSATASTTFSESPTANNESEKIWSGEMSSVIGLQKRGLRGLMEGRRLRERTTTQE